MSATVPLSYAAPIAVGHRVELTWFVKPGGRRGNTPTSMPFEPVLRDLDTGIVYGTDWHFGTFAAFRSDYVHPYVTEPPPRLEVERTLRGRVASCTVVNISIVSDPYQHTILVLDEES